MRKVLALLICGIFVLTLSGCSSHESNAQTEATIPAAAKTAEETPTATPIETATPTPIVVTEQPTATPGPTSYIPPTGILAIRETKGTPAFDNVNGQRMCTTKRIDLDYIDPITGSYRHFKTFSTLKTHSCTILFSALTQNTYEFMLSFDETMTRMTAYCMMQDGGSHIGWIDEKGQFTDVTDMISVRSDFGGVINHISPSFYGGYLYFRDLTETQGAIKRVPLDNLVPSAVEVIVTGTKWNGAGTHPRPDGSILDESMPVSFYDASLSQAAKLSICSDWINAYEWVGEESSSMNYYGGVTIYRYSFTNPKGTSGDYKKTALVPSIKGRANYSPVVSPDGSEVAFISQLDNGETGMFIVSSEGGDPRKVPTHYALPVRGNTGGTETVVFLDWQ